MPHPGFLLLAVKDILPYSKRNYFILKGSIIWWFVVADTHFFSHGYFPDINFKELEIKARI